MSDGLEVVRRRVNEVCRVVFGGNEAEMAREIGWKRPTLHRILSGSTKKIDTALIDALVEYGVRRDWLSGEGGRMMQGGDGDASQVVERVLALIDRYDKELDNLDGAVITGTKGVDGTYSGRVTDEVHCVSATCLTGTFKFGSDIIQNFVMFRTVD